MAGFDPQVTPLRHSVARIGGQIHQNLLNLQRIDAHPPQSFTAHESELDIFPDEPGEGIGDARDHLIQIRDPQGLRLFAAEGQQLPGQVRPRGAPPAESPEFLIQADSLRVRCQGPVPRSW